MANREGLTHVFFPDLAGDVCHRSSPEFGREGFVGFLLVLKFDDSEEPVTEFGELFRNEAGKLAFFAMAIDPAAHHERREDREKRGARDENAEAGKRWGGDEAIEDKDDQEGNNQAEEPCEYGFDYLSAPQLALKLSELFLELLRNGSQLR